MQASVRSANPVIHRSQVERKTLTRKYDFDAYDSVVLTALLAMLRWCQTATCDARDRRRCPRLHGNRTVDEPSLQANHFGCSRPPTQVMISVC